MKQTFIQQTGSPCLLLFFAGWGMDETPFRNVRPQGCDFMICYDYRNLDFNPHPLSPYREIHLMAWSMGVWAASQVMQNHELPITQSVAINGTPYPVDETRGIAPSVFEGTLEGLNETTLQKFRRRMCGSATIYKAFEKMAPQRSVEELKEELAAIGQQCRSLPPSSFSWDKAVIGEADRIFLPENQSRAWQNTPTQVKYVDGAHYIIHDYLIPTEEGARRERIHLIARRFTKAIDTYPHEARIQHQIAAKMNRLLQHHLPRRTYKQIVEFGCGTGAYSRLLLDSLHPERLLLNDICPEMQACCQDMLYHCEHAVSFVSGDAERMPFPKDTELITSCSTLQWFEHPEEFFRRCNEALNAHGYFAFSTFGQQNMKEIRRLTGQGLSYRSLTELENSLRPLYDIVHAEEEILSLPFSTPMEVLYHLKQTGVTGTANTVWTRSKLSLFCNEYKRLFPANGNGVSLTYHPIYIIAKKKEV